MEMAIIDIQQREDCTLAQAQEKFVSVQDFAQEYYSASERRINAINRDALGKLASNKSLLAWIDADLNYQSDIADRSVMSTISRAHVDDVRKHIRRAIDSTAWNLIGVSLVKAVLAGDKVSQQRHFDVTTRGRAEALFWRSNSSTKQTILPYHVDNDLIMAWIETLTTVADTPAFLPYVEADIFDFGLISQCVENGIDTSLAKELFDRAQKEVSNNA